MTIASQEFFVVTDKMSRSDGLGIGGRMAALLFPESFHLLSTL